MRALEITTGSSAFVLFCLLRCLRLATLYDFQILMRHFDALMSRLEMLLKRVLSQKCKVADATREHGLMFHANSRSLPTTLQMIAQIVTAEELPVTMLALMLEIDSVHLLIVRHLVTITLEFNLAGETRFPLLLSTAMHAQMMLQIAFTRLDDNATKARNVEFTIHVGRSDSLRKVAVVVAIHAHNHLRALLVEPTIHLRQIVIFSAQLELFIFFASRSFHLALTGRRAKSQLMKDLKVLEKVAAILQHFAALAWHIQLFEEL